jgi:hypothetical protein
VGFIKVLVSPKGRVLFPIVQAAAGTKTARLEVERPDMITVIGGK